MASAQVILKISPNELSLIQHCLQTEREINLELIHDSVVKDDDKADARRIILEIDNLRRQIK